MKMTFTISLNLKALSHQELHALCIETYKKAAVDSEARKLVPQIQDEFEDRRLGLTARGLK